MSKQEITPWYLTHPNIPKPLHGVNPRTIFGKEWWDIERRKAYAVNDYRCWACGVPKSQAKYHHWLEAHEHYYIYYEQGIVDFIELIALCHSCHNFIHSGRMYALLKKGEMSKAKVLDILMHGFDLLDAHADDERIAGPFYNTVAIWNELTGDNKPYEIPKTKMAPWEKWRLKIGDKEYPPKFKSFDEWRAYYG